MFSSNMRSVLHEETCNKSDYCCMSLHTVGFYSTNIEHLYKMPFEIPFSMFRTPLGLPLWCSQNECFVVLCCLLKSYIWLGPILHWSHHLLVNKKNANCFCINSLKLRMAHMVEKGQPIDRNGICQSHWLTNVPDYLGFIYEKNPKSISVYSLKNIF